MDILTPEQRRKKCKQLNPWGTNIKNSLAKTLYSNGIR